MLTVVVLNVLAILFAYFESCKILKQGLKIAFLLIFTFLALRYDYGNDYQAYLQGFVEINSYASIDYSDETFYFEPGWLFLCRLFKPFGFFIMVGFLAAFNCFVYYQFIKKYVTPNYYWLAVFLYVFGAGFMLTHSSAMRQSLAISLFLISINYLYKKDAIRYFLCIGLASLFHISALILLPLYLLTLYEWKINLKIAIIIFALYLMLFLFGVLFVNDINRFLSLYFSRYSEYQGTTEIGSGIGLIITSILFGSVLYFGRFQTKQSSILFKIAILSYLIIPISLNLSQLGRIGMYFQPALLVVFPAMMLNLKGFFLRQSILATIILLTLYGFFGFFQSDVWGEAFSSYRTIFSAPQIY